MAYPTPYLVTYSYTSFAQGLGDGSFPGAQLDQDFADMGAALGVAITFLDGITRSDGALKNGIVTTDALDTTLAAALGNITAIAAIQALITTANADVVLTHADVVSTHADVVLTHADAVSTAASAAAAAASVAALSGTSTTSLLIATGAKTFVTQSGKRFSAGEYLQIASNASALNFMHGTVTSYVGTSLVMDIVDIGGSGTFADWNISVSGSRGPAGAVGATGAAGTNGTNGVNGSLTTATAGGTADAITATYSPVNGSLTDKLVLAFVASAANATTTPTFAPDGLTAHTIVKRGGVALAVGDIPGALAVCLVEYNLANTRWELLNPAAYQALDAQLSSLVRQNSKSAAYTTVLADGGEQIYHPGADTTARIWTIDSNANVAYPIGTAITFVNDLLAGVITLKITLDTLVLAGVGSTGDRTLAAGGMATAIKMTATRWMISGAGLA